MAQAKARRGKVYNADNPSGARPMRPSVKRMDKVKPGVKRTGMRSRPKGY